jgi:acetyltransferase-like isoleucine patch superfamily enzyme
MTTIVKLAIEISWKFYWLLTKTVARIRRAVFPCIVTWYGGTLDLDSSVHFDHPVMFQGRGHLILSEGVILGYWMAGSRKQPILFQPRDPSATIEIGKNTVIINGTEMIARSSIKIGENCRIGPRCVFMDADFHGIKPDQRHLTGLTVPITLEDNVWIGSDVFVLKGVRIGQDAIIGARSVVAKDVPAGAIAVGNPMRVVGSVYA